MIRPQFVALGAFVLAVVGAAALGIARDHESWEWSVAPPEPRLDVFTMTVDGEVFEVWTPTQNPNQRNFDWLSGPKKDYGFAVGPSAPMTWTKAFLEEQIRDFLATIDPETGYVADD